MRSRFFLAVGPALLASVLLLASAPLPAVADARPHTVGPYKVKDLRVISGPSPFAAGCPGARFDETNITGRGADVAAGGAGRRQAVPSGLVDPETGAELPQPGFPSTAVAPDGSVYVAFEDSTSPTSGAVGVARSRDGGRTWTTGALPGVRAFAFEPAIAVDSHGTVGVTWYDLRNDRPGDAALTADVWFAHSDDGGASWRQTHVAGPTDLRTAPLPDKNYVGEYQGLAALRGRGFAAIFTMAAPLAKNGPTDIFFARIGPG